MLDDSRPRPVSSAEPYSSRERRPRPRLVLKTVSPEVLSPYLALLETQKAVSKLARSLTAEGTPAAVLEDLEQEVHVAAVSAQSRPRSPETMKAWLKTLVRRALQQPADPVDPPEDPWLLHD